MISNPHDFNARIYVAAYQARRQEEAALRHMPLVDRLGAPLARKDMDVLLAVLWALIVSVGICFAFLILSPAASADSSAGKRASSVDAGTLRDSAR